MNLQVKTNKHTEYDKPLPCRGCTKSCPNISKCNGKPWRTLNTGVGNGKMGNDSMEMLLNSG